MSSGSIFDAEAKRSVNWKIFLIGFLAFAAIFGSAYALYLYSKPREKTTAEKVAEEIRDAAVMMLAQPTFSGEEFKTQILGDKGRLQWFDRKNREAYFSYPQAEQQELDDFLSKYFVDLKKVEFGTGDSRLYLGKMQLRVTPETQYFFKTPLENIKIAPEQTLNFGFKEVNYTLSLDEMRNFVNNSQVYGGRLIAGTELKETKPLIVFANHAIMVAKPEEPSLQRLAKDLLKDETIYNDREKKIQRLVDFVSNEIEYSYTEAVGARETLKRANETLMTRSADCSNKTILLASLLEQIGEEYILLYCPQHITVAVPQGNFPNENKIDFTWNGKPWLIAETTLPGFQVGITRVQEYARLTKINYVQSPKQSDIIFDADSYAVLKFY